jgi:hypothetical protein
MAGKPDITPELLRQLLRYEPETGKLFWRNRSPEFFTSDGQFLRWNNRHAGAEAFTADTGTGYRHGAVLCQQMTAHRVAWAIHYGEWPHGQIDHINHERSDNRLTNLRNVTPQENAQNRSSYKNNTSGSTGVHWSAHHRRWRAQIVVQGTRHRLGLFQTIEDAIAARKTAEREYGFHINHGV